MATELHVAYSASGRTLYAVVRNQAGQVWNPGIGNFEAYDASHLGSYALALAEQGSSQYYVGSMPGNGPGVYFVAIYDQQGGSPAEGDPLVGPLQAIPWNGGSVATALDVLALLPSALVSGRMDCHVGDIADDAVTSGALAASAVTELQSGLASQSSVDGVAGIVPTLASQGDMTTALAGLSAIWGVVPTLASQGDMTTALTALSTLVGRTMYDANLVQVNGTAAMLGGVSFYAAMQLIFAACGGGPTSGATGGTFTISAQGGVDLSVMTYDADGNRTGVSIVYT